MTILSNVYKPFFLFLFLVMAAAPSYAIDTDSDGTDDLVDIDDDNDGVLDAVESPSCFYSRDEVDSIQAVGSDMVWHASYDYPRATDQSSTFTQLSGINQAVTAKTLIEFDFVAALSFQQIELQMGAYRSSRAANDGEFKLQGWNGSWVDLSPPKYAMVANGMETFTNSLQPAGTFTKARIQGVSGRAYYSRIVESFITLGVYVPSLHPKPSLCAEDIDGNNVANHLDLDSDGDGCSDAYETRATLDLTPNFQFPDVDGNNDGLVDSVDAGNSQVNYTATYHYALSGGLEACLDTDSDGVPDVVDLDADNDGVPDAIESSACFFTEDEATQISATGSDLIWNASYGYARAADGDPATFPQTAPRNQFIAGMTIIQYDLVGDFQIDRLELDMGAYSISMSATDGEVVLQGLSAGTWVDLSLPKHATQANSFEIFQNTLVPNGYFSKLRIHGLSGKANYVRIDETYVFLKDFFASSNPRITCAGNNHLSLDSDGDGCSDAFEAGATTNLTANYQFPDVDSNADGLVNLVDPDSDGEINYEISYLDVATSASLDGCSDFDLDKTPDLLDLDDDNDGVLDVLESPMCFVEEDALDEIDATGSDLDWHASYGYSRATDDDVVTFTQLRTLNQPLADRTIISFDIGGNFRVEALDLEMGARRISNSATDGLMKLQGWHGTWFDLSPPAAAMVANGIQRFENTLRPGSTFSKVRLRGVSGTAYYARIDEATIVVETASGGYPKSTCNNDLDNDTWPNHLDVDSDGEGCSDAFESGATTILTPNYQFPDVDANSDGLVDVVDSDSNKEVDYDLRYQNIALESALDACHDSDLDGTPDLADLDDDNDGVLDVVESPTCFFSASEMNEIDATASDLDWHASYGFARATDGDATSFTQLRSANQGITDRTIIAFDIGGNFRVQSLDLEMGAYRMSRSATDGLVKLQGWHGSWIDLSTPDYALTANGIESFVNTLRPGSTFSKLRIQGVSGTAYYSRIDEATVVVETASGSYTKTTCSNDIDLDNKPNHLDGDSDGDNCSDAYETGATKDLTSSYQFPDVDFNNDGLVDAVDSMGDGSIDYTSSHPYAISAVLDACADSDGDLIGDLLDIDDDNDGILDVHESAPGFGPQIPLAGLSPTHIQDYSASYPAEKAIDGIASVSSIAITRGTTTTDWWQIDLGAPKLIGGLHVYARTNVTQSMRNVYVMVSQTPFAGNDLATARANADFEFQLPDNTSGILMHTIPTGAMFGRYIRLQKSGVNNRNYLEWTELNVFEPNTTDRHSDSDGIPDRLDLDSDNDTIPDNIEAQLTASYVAPGIFADVNQDGLNDIYGPGLTPVDTDLDSEPDFIDLNSDAEGGFDIVEVGQGALDSDADGRTDGAVGSNGLDNSMDTADNYSDVNGTLNDPTTLPNIQAPSTPEVDYRDDELTDECLLGTDTCDVNATCSDEVTGYSCACNAGWTGDGFSCVDENECQLNTDNCGANAICTNIDGSFECDCSVGYTGDGITCVAGGCGDGTTTAPETCDDSNLIPFDGCSDTCFIDNIANGGDCSANGSISCQSGLCDFTETIPACEPLNTCGNGLIEGTEVCDDGNSAAGDGCSPICELTGSDFNRRYDLTANGAVVTASNGLITCDSADSRCQGAQDFTGTLYQNGPFMMVNIDADSDATTFNSSAAVLTLPANSTVKFAGLYWGGQYSDHGKPYKWTAPPSAADRDKIRFKVPGATNYVTLSGSVEETDGSFYQGFVDVTSLVSTGGEYWAADAQLTTGKQMYGGWSLVVVVEATALPERRLVVWDGFLKHTHHDILLNLVDTFPARRADSSTEMSLIIHDGDKGNWDSMLLDDALFFPNDVYGNSDPAPSGDIANSTITKLGNRFEDRTPFYQNTLGYDDDVFEIGPTINLDPHLNIRFRTRHRGDIKHIGVIAIQADVAQNFVQSDWSGGANSGSSNLMTTETQFLSSNGHVFHDSVPDILRSSQFSYTYDGSKYEFEPFRSELPDTAYYNLWKTNQVAPPADCLKSQFWLYRESDSTRISWMAGANQQIGGSSGCDGKISSSYNITGSAVLERSDDASEATLTGFNYHWINHGNDGHVINFTTPEFKVDGTILARTGAVSHSAILSGTTAADYDWNGPSSWSIESDFDGELDSKVFDAGTAYSFGTLNLDVTGTNGSSAVVYFRTGDSEADVLGKAWEGPFVDNDTIGSTITNNKQFFQYRIVTLLTDPGPNMPESELDIEEISFALNPLILPSILGEDYSTLTRRAEEAAAGFRLPDAAALNLGKLGKDESIGVSKVADESDWEVHDDAIAALSDDFVGTDDSGCSSTNDGPSSWLLLLAIGFLMRRRNKKQTQN